MKNLLLVLSFSPFLLFGQDKVILLTADTLSVNVIKSTPTEIEYNHLGETSVNVLPKNRIFKIEYSSGRTEVVRTHGNVDGGRNKPMRPKVTPRFRWGLRVGANMPMISGLDNGSTNRVGGLIGVSTEIKFLNTRSSIIIDAYANQMYARSPSGSDDIEVVYLSLPIMYGASVNNWFIFMMGIEPSITVTSDYYQTGNHYDAATVTNAAAMGITAGGRFFITPNKIYIDARGVVGTSDMFKFGENSPHKINLSIGYYIKY